MPTRAFEYVLASLSGLLLALSFPRYGHPAVAWVALTPLLLALLGTPRSYERPVNPMGRAFALGLLTGAVFFTGTLYWITRVMAIYGGLSLWVAVIINAALIAYLSLFPAIFAIVVRRLALARGTIALAVAPLVWVATELGRTYLLTGFPWVLLGYSQARVLPIAQLASLFGVCGVSMLVAAVNASLVSIALRVTSTPRERSSAIALSFPVGVFALVAVVAVWGSRRVSTAELTRMGDPIRVGLVQGNVDQGEKWDPARAAAIFQDYLRLTRAAIDRGAELVLWPESSTPFYFEEDRPGAESVRTLARAAHVSILVGSDQIEWKIDKTQRVPDKYYNSAFLVRPDGTTAGFYRKMHLVPFGEYVPLKELLFFAGPLVEAVGPFSAGTEPSLLPVNGHLMSVAICYEVVYPNLIRQFVARGSELLSTITNDAWFGRTSAPYQHFEQASMRAVEEGRYLVRSANTGISGIVDPYGRVLERTDIFQQAVLVGSARMLKTSTFYARHGDLVAYAAAVMTIAALIVVV
jgi:apolipoprotein N-acyltransferase